jgi:hypothetical protein
VSISFTDTGAAADVLLAFTDTGTCDDQSGFTASPFADSGAAADTIGTGPVITDSGTGDGTLGSPAVAVLLAETGTADDLPWEYISLGQPVFAYYADLPAAAAGRVQAGDQFDWYAGG